ncbi:hypothetical protein THAOC_00761, partial [Thalassiosira oceanica]
QNRKNPSHADSRFKGRPHSSDGFLQQFGFGPMSLDFGLGSPVPHHNWGQKDGESPSAQLETSHGLLSSLS